MTNPAWVPLVFRWRGGEGDHDPGRMRDRVRTEKPLLLGGNGAKTRRERFWIGPFTVPASQPFERGGKRCKTGADTRFGATQRRQAKRGEPILQGAEVVLAQDQVIGKVPGTGQKRLAQSMRRPGAKERVAACVNIVAQVTDLRGKLLKCRVHVETVSGRGVGR